ncbi:D-tyrosyl-tRNA(Tyr) deacylase [Lachnospiraceae bacterium]|nr:D-tyrosyl-tRNA(Tyr) deacylase [Lachnospiraceae bacterium]
MRFLIQRVHRASVETEGKVIGEIQNGFLVFIGICQTDNTEIANKMIRKLIGLRIFEDEHGKTNLSLENVSGELLLISQFTLYADCKKGNRPSFIKSGDPGFANTMYEYIISECQKQIPVVQTGKFGADMKISLINDGPFTIMLDSDEIC